MFMKLYSELLTDKIMLTLYEYNKTDFINRYDVLIRYSALKHIISFHFYIMNQFFKNNSRNYQTLHSEFNF